jgi:hypothetical protein
MLLKGRVFGFAALLLIVCRPDGRFVVGFFEFNDDQCRPLQRAQYQDVGRTAPRQRYDKPVVAGRIVASEIRLS